MPHLDIQLLGDFRLTFNGREVRELKTSRLQSLFVYLLLFCQTPQPRRRIAFLFWPDTSEKQALSNLRTTYARLRQKLPESDLFLQADRQSIQWLPEVTYRLDVAQFESAASSGHSLADWSTAVDLYRGPLLPGWYEEWLEPERERLQQLFLQTGEKLLQHQEERRDYGAAIQTAHLLLRHDVLNELIYRHLMRLQAINGNKADALRTYHTCATLLEEELGVTPDQHTIALYEQLLQTSIEKIPTPSAEPETANIPLIGRQEEWRQLQHAWQRASRGLAGLVLISGEAGTGKTRLAAELLQWARHQGFDAFSARSFEAEGELAYTPVLTWLRSPALKAAWSKLDDFVLSELARLMPELLVERLDLPPPAPLTQSWQRQRLFQVLAQAVLARNRPLLLHIDDLQWCDRETLEWLHFLLRFEPRPPILLLGAYRPEEIRSGHPLTSLQLSLYPSRQIVQLELRPLEKSEVFLLADHYAGQTLGSRELEHLYQETEGNPLFVIEMMRAGVTEQRALPPTIQAMIQARFAQVTTEARELIAQASVIGRAFDYTLLAQVSGMSEDLLVTRLDELWRRRLIREHGRVEYDFSHDKFREVAYAELSQARRFLLHKRVAQSLETLHASHIGAYSGQIAAHYERAGLPMESIPYYQMAAEAAQQLYSADKALNHIQRALRLLSSLPDSTPASWQKEREAQLYESQGDILYFSAHYREAQEAYEMARSAVAVTGELNPVWQCRLLRKSGRSCVPQHHYEDALNYYERAQASLGSQPASAEIAWWREWIDTQQERKYVYYWLNRWPDIAAIIEESKPIVGQYGTARQRAEFFDPSMYYRRDRFAVSKEVLGYTREWHAANLELNDPVRQAAAHFSLGFALLWHGALSEAEVEMTSALEMTKQTGDLNLRARCLTYLTLVNRKLDQVEVVSELADQSITAAEEAAMPEYVAMAKANLCWVAWRESDFPRAQKSGHSALEFWRRLPEGHASAAFQWTALFPLAAISLAQNNLPEIISYVATVLDPSQQKLPDDLSAVFLEVLSAYEQDHVAEARDYLKQSLALARQLHYL